MVRRPSVAELTAPRSTPMSARVSPPARRPDPDHIPAESSRPEVVSPLLLTASDRAPVIRSKIQPPPVRTSTLARARLLDRLNDFVRSRLTLIAAEAGYGKTTLLADFSSRASVRCLWYKLDPTDSDPITWTNYLIAAAREVDPAFGAGTQSLLAQVGPGGPPESAFVASLLGELPRLGEAPTILVLDDFHAVEDSRDAHEYVSRLIKDGPSWLHFVIASRRRPVLEISRLAAMGELNEISTDDLRFTVDETARLFADGYGMALEPDVLRDLDSRTQGWAASLQLFHGSVRGRPSTAIRALAKSLSGASNPIYDFLAQEVLNNLADDLGEFLIRCSLLDRVVPPNVVELFEVGEAGRPDLGLAQQWIEEADRIGLLSRSSQTSEARQLHPLLREFLVGTLRQRHSEDEVRAMHLRLARALSEHDPLTASRHYIDGGKPEEAMECLGRSVMLTMGTAQWGMASALVERLDGVPGGAPVIAIRARRLIEAGEVTAALELLLAIDEESCAPDVRANIRNAKVAIGWRTGNQALLFEALEKIRADPETPHVMREIAQAFIDTSPMAKRPIEYPQLARRLIAMSQDQLDHGYGYFAGVSMHNAAIAEFVAGRATESVVAGERALDLFEQLPFPPSERFSTHAVLATAWIELGREDRAREHIALGDADEGAHADVHAEFAYLFCLIGSRAEAEDMLLRAETQRRRGLTDIQADSMSILTRALLDQISDPQRGLESVGSLTRDRPMDVGDTLRWDGVMALCDLMLGNSLDALDRASTARRRAQQQLAVGAEARLALIEAMALGDGERLREAVERTGRTGNVGLLEAADALGQRLHLLTPIPRQLTESIRRWPGRWLPVLRRQLERGNDPTARTAALILDEEGQLEDIPRLRAYAKTYGKRGRVSSQLGVALAKRVGPKLHVQDLGRVRLRVGSRSIELSGMRRKPASLLLYLVTRPNFTATREQVLDELWPDNDPGSASNSLNQSLYFLRRDIDPWYEDDLSIEYVPFQGDIVWLDPDLVQVDSANFLSATKTERPNVDDADRVLALLSGYSGQFAPEFEYDEWAMPWRSRIHVAFLEFAHLAINRLIREGRLSDAQDVALKAFEIDPESRDLERKLIGLYWRRGVRSAARAQYAHFAARDRSDGLDPPTLESIAEGDLLADE
jgi:DNA-binding SARP family transcriptional activator